MTPIWIRNLLGALLGFGAINAFAGGWYGFSGAPGVPLEWLAGSPFTNYVVPSLVLLAVVGGAFAFAAIAVLARWRVARRSALFAGIVVLFWLGAQVAIIGYVSWMQPATFAGGVLILLLTSRLPSSRNEACGLREIAPDVYCLGPSGRTQTNVYFVREGSSWVLIDAGWASDSARIDRAAESLLEVTARPTAILLTHCHPDHSGAARHLARLWACPVYMHARELPIANGDFAAMQASAGPLDRYVVLPFMRLIGRRRREAILAASRLGDVGRTIEPGAAVPCLPSWQCIATPGHTPGHVAYFRQQDRVLVSGDALATFKINSVWGLLLALEGLSGPPWYTTWNREAARRSIRMLADLNPYVLAGGHGRPLVGRQTAAVLRSFAGRFAR